MEKLIFFQIENTREIEADEVLLTELIFSLTILSNISLYIEASASISPAVTDSKLPADSILIFCDLSEKHLNRMLFELKSRKVQIDLKAILTPTNRRWTLRQLHGELNRERASFT